MTEHLPTLPDTVSTREIGFLGPGETVVAWPDSEGELLFDSEFYRATDPSSDELRTLRELAAAAGGRLVVRTITSSAASYLAAPLPDTPGSVVSATYRDQQVRAFLRSEQAADSVTRWSLDRPVDGVLFVADEDLDRVSILFESTA